MEKIAENSINVALRLLGRIELLVSSLGKEKREYFQNAIHSLCVLFASKSRLYHKWWHIGKDFCDCIFVTMIRFWNT